MLVADGNSQGLKVVLPLHDKVDIAVLMWLKQMCSIHLYWWFIVNQTQVTQFNMFKHPFPLPHRRG